MKRSIALLCAAVLLAGLFSACATQNETDSLGGTYWKAVEFGANGIGLDEFWSDLFLWEDGTGYFRFSQATQESHWYGFRDVFGCPWALEDGLLMLSTGETVYVGAVERDRLVNTYGGLIDEEFSITMERADMPPYGTQWEIPDLYGAWQLAPEENRESEITAHPASGVDYWLLDGNSITMEHSLRMERVEGPGWEGCENRAWHARLSGGDPAKTFTAAIAGDKLLLKTDGEIYEYEWAGDGPQYVFHDWEGIWDRIGTGEDSAEITITDATEDAFEFSFQGCHITLNGSAHTGDLEGTARFTTENKALCEYEDEYGGETITFGFVMYDGKLLVCASENVLGLFGFNVYIDGVYAK